jgi:hypothetical protein
MTFYLISDPSHSRLALFSSSNLEAVAEAIVAQSRIEPSSVYVTLDGKPRSLSAGPEPGMPVVVAGRRATNSTDGHRR